MQITSTESFEVEIKFVQSFYYACAIASVNML